MRQVEWKKNKQKTKKKPAIIPFFAYCHYKDYKENNSYLLPLQAS